VAAPPVVLTTHLNTFGYSVEFSHRSSGKDLGRGRKTADARRRAWMSLKSGRLLAISRARSAGMDSEIRAKPLKACQMI